MRLIFGLICLWLILCLCGPAFPLNAIEDYNSRFGKSSMDYTKAVIHHTAGSALSDRDLTVEEIDRYHKERGWDGIGYHFLIRKDGTVYKGRPLWKKGAHAKGRNNYIGIALTGYQTFTDEQVSSLKKLLKDLGVTHVERHHEECPSDALDVEGLLTHV